MAFGLWNKHKQEGTTGSVTHAAVLQETSRTGQKPAHLVSVQELARTDVEALMERAEALRQMSRALRRTRLEHAVVATLFYEPSTRTRLSFEAAAYQLGAQVITAENARDNSSAKKGESLEDVFRVVGRYSDAIVIRHHEDDTVAAAAPYSPVPVLSAGAGAGEHPTQALLDVYTLWRELGRVDGLKLCVMGDLKYGRTVHSLLKLLTRFSGIEVTLLHPASLGLPDGLFQTLLAAGMRVTVSDDVASALACADAVYQTRIQTERLDPTDEFSPGQFVLGTKELEQMQPHARILHPLPRVNEIRPEVDDDERAAYFRQVENGLYMRMAVLDEWIGRPL